MNTATATKTATAVTVTFPNGVTETFKGKRAAAAAAVSLGRWNDGTWIVSIHATEAAARKNAATQSIPAYAGGDHWNDAQVVVL